MGIVTDIILPLSLAFIMFSLGLGLTSSDFKRIIVQPKDFIVGAFSQIFILPLVAFILVLVWPLNPMIAVGVMILAAAPGGATSNILTSFAKGDVALSISLTAIISLLCVFTIPFIVISSLDFFSESSLTNDIKVFDIAIRMFLIVTIPVLLGMVIRNFFNSFSANFEPIAKNISIFLFALVLIGAIISERENVISYFSQAGLITLVLNLIMMIIAFFLAKILGSGKKQRKAITIECGLQNGTLAIFIGTTLFNGETYIVPAATYSLIMFITSLIFIFIVRKVN